MAEIGRTKDWSEGVATCPRCGAEHRLYWNGGELDMKMCECGVVIQTEHQATDLVFYDSPPWRD